MGGGKHPFASLRDVARERRAAESDESDWLERRAGRLPEPEEQALEGRAESDDYVAHMRALTAPLDGAAQEALLANVAELVGHAQPQSGTEGRAVAAVPAAPAATVSDLSARRRLKTAGFAGVALAAAAALLVMMRGPGAELTLPPYEGQLEGADRAVRGAEDPAPHGERQPISAGAQVQLTVRPLEALPSDHTQLAGKLFLVQGATAEPVPVPVQLAPSGAAQVSAPYEALFGARSGAWDLVLFVGVASSLPESTSAALAQLEQPLDDVRSVRFPIALTR